MLLPAVIPLDLRLLLCEQAGTLLLPRLLVLLDSERAEPLCPSVALLQGQVLPGRRERQMIDWGWE